MKYVAFVAVSAMLVSLNASAQEVCESHRMVQGQDVCIRPNVGVLLLNMAALAPEKTSAVIEKIRQNGMQAVFNHPKIGFLAVYLPEGKDGVDSTDELLEILKNEGVLDQLVPKHPSALFGQQP